MSVAIITGSGTHALPGIDQAQTVPVSTPYGEVEVSSGEFAGAEVLHVSRHGAGHARLSNHVTHRANIWALHRLGASAVLACTAAERSIRRCRSAGWSCSTTCTSSPTGFPDGSLCTFFDTPGEAGRGHWVLHGGPFSPALRRHWWRAPPSPDTSARDAAPRPRRRSPVQHPLRDRLAGRLRRRRGQPDRGSETVLCGELELPYALIGFVTDHANEVIPGSRRRSRRWRR